MRAHAGSRAQPTDEARHKSLKKSLEVLSSSQLVKLLLCVECDEE